MIFNGKAEDRFIGLMSGTSLDGVDAVLVQFPAPQQVKVLGRASFALSCALTAGIVALTRKSRRRVTPSGMCW